MDAVRDLKNMRHVVADEDHRQTPVAHAADQLQHHVAFLDAQRRRRFIEDDDVFGKRCRPRHRHALALAARERFHRLRHAADADFQVVHALDADVQHLFLVQLAEHRTHDPLAAQLAAKEQVFGDRHRGGDGQILINRLDAVAPGIDGALELHRAAINANLAPIRHDGARQRLDERRFARTVVPNHRQDFAGAQLEVHPIQRRDLAVALHQALGLHHQLRRGHVSGLPCAKVDPPSPPESPRSP